MVNETEQALIRASELATDNQLSPLVLEKSQLFLQRYWFYEHRLALQIKQLLDLEYPAKDLDQLLDRYFIQLIDETDWQRVAAKKAVSNAFCIITGGPGTGKTTTVVKVLALLLEQNPSLTVT